MCFEKVTFGFLVDTHAPLTPAYSAATVAFAFPNIGRKYRPV